MKLRWSDIALSDLTKIADYLFDRTPQHTDRIVLTVYESPNVLLQFPLLGRVGRKTGTRELALTPLPYILVYRVNGQMIHVVRVLHGAQKYP